NATTRPENCRTRAARVRGRDNEKSAGAKRHPPGGRAHRGPPSNQPPDRARRAVAKLNLLLLAVLVACALGLVTSQHSARKLFSERERENARARELDVEYGRLQIEASTWGLHSRVEKIASGSLGLHAADPRRVRVVGHDPR